MKHYILKIGFLCAILSCSGMAHAQNLSRKQEKYYQQEILKYINQYRANRNLSPLVLDENLNRIAFGHSEDMSDGQVGFGHGGFDDRMAMARRSNTQLRGFAENVAYGLQTPQEVSKDWYNSPGHKRNLLGNYVKTGIGVERASDGYLYFTQIFER